MIPGILVRHKVKTCKPVIPSLRTMILLIICGLLAVKIMISNILASRLALPSSNTVQRNFHGINKLGVDGDIAECCTRVITDIDDTVKSSGGVSMFGIQLGGVDVS